jgi:hypothetical protein
MLSNSMCHGERSTRRLSAASAKSNHRRNVTYRWLATFLLSCLAFSAAPAFADTRPVTAADPFALFDTLQQVDNSTLSTMRGKYVPPAQTHVLVPQTTGLTTELPQASALPIDAHTESDPLSGLSGTGPVVYFGVTMTSSWAQSGNGEVSAMQTIGVNAQNDVVTISQSTDGGTLNASADPADKVGASSSSDSSGVTQIIQVAGNGNSVQNQASLTVSTSGPTVTGTGPFVGTTTVCGTGCTTTINGTGTPGITIVTPEGTISQTIGSVNGISQTVQLAGNANTVVNAMNMQAQLGRSTSNSGAVNLLPILQSMNGLLP